MNKSQQLIVSEVTTSETIVTLKDLTKDVLGHLGYCNYKSYMDSYLIRIAKDISTELQDIIYVHEIGHIYYGHMTINHQEEFNKIKTLFLKKNPQVKYIINESRLFHEIENVAMDLEVNTKLLSIMDLKILRDNNYEGYSTSYKNVPAGLRFDEYYSYIIEKVECTQMMDDGSGKFKVPYAFVMDGEIKLTNSYYQDEDKDKDGGDQWKYKKDKDDLRSYGTMNDASDPFILDKSDKSIRMAIQSLLTNDNVKRYNYCIDSLKIYNRKSRGDNNFLYSSMKRKRYKQFIPSKLNVLVDVSGSMDKKSVGMIIKTLVELDKGLSNSNRVILFNNRLVNDMPIKVATRSELYSGGGTDMAKGLKYCKANKLEEVIVISDMCTDIPEFNEELIGIKCHIIRLDDKLTIFKNIKKYEY